MEDKIYVAADTLNGVHEVDAMDFPTTENMDFPDFLENLKTLRNNETIYTIVYLNTPEYEILENDYGIN